MWSYYEWIRNQVASNTPWDVMTRRLLQAQGSSLGEMGRRIIS
jgi:hypothetical protein